MFVSNATEVSVNTSGSDGLRQEIVAVNAVHQVNHLNFILFESVYFKPWEVSIVKFDRDCITQGHFRIVMLLE
jgi:hypothetical protein